MPVQSATEPLALFPLRTVLFPGGQLPLRIFETRYLDLVSDCMRHGRTFGVVLIRHGQEAGVRSEDAQPDIFEVGTEARIVDFNRLSDGLLGIVCRGERKFRVTRTWSSPAHLLMTDAHWLIDEPQGSLAPEHAPLVEILEELVQHPLIQKLNLAIDMNDMGSVSRRLSELLPIDPEIKQALLQIAWPRERMAELSRIVAKLRG